MFLSSILKMDLALRYKGIGLWAGYSFTSDYARLKTKLQRYISEQGAARNMATEIKAPEGCITIKSPREVLNYTG